MRTAYSRLAPQLTLLLALQGVLPAGQQKPKEETCLVRFRDGMFGYLPHRVGEEELLEYYATKAADADLPQSRQAHYRRTYLDLLLNFDVGRAERDMPMVYSAIGSKSPELLTLSANWEWRDRENRREGREWLVHTSSDARPHSASGMCRHIIPTGAVLAQSVYLDPQDPPKQIAVGFTVPVAGYAGHFTNRTCQARWGGAPIPVSTDNTPSDFYAGPLPEKGKWVTLEVPAVSIGLGGVRRLFFGITFTADGGKALWGPTVFRRSELELITSKALGIYHWAEGLDLRALLNNVAATSRTYDLSYTIYDIDGNPLYFHGQRVTVPPTATQEVPLEIPRELYTRRGGLFRRRRRSPFRSYFVVHASVSRAGAVTKARTAFGFILPNRTGRDADSPFGTMLWDRPASREGVALYRDAGIKTFSINPGAVRDGEGPLLSLFAASDMYLHARIWELAFVCAKDARAHTGSRNPLIPKLSRKAAKLKPKHGRFISNFWEVDLRNLPETYGLNANYFYEASKQGNPEAVVGTGGLAGVNTAYINRMLGSGGAGYLDFVTCMAYFTPSPPERSGLFEQARAVRQIFGQHGVPETQLWFSEWNYFDHLNLERPDLGADWIHSGVSRDLISSYMVREALMCLAAGAAKVLPNAPFQTSRPPLRQTYGHTMTGCSSHRHDYSPLPLYFAWSVLTRNVEGKVCSGLVECGPGVFCVKFDAVRESYHSLKSAPCVLAVWSEYGPKAVGLHVGQKAVRVIDFVGNTTELRTVAGTVTLAAVPRPQYVLLDTPSQTVRSVAALGRPTHLWREVARGERARVRVGVEVENPADKELPLRVAFRGPYWCVAEPGEREVELGPRQRDVVHFEINVPEDNDDRVHYEFAELASRAEHYLTFALSRGRHRVGTVRTALLVRKPVEARLRPLLQRRSDHDQPRLVVSIQNRTGVAKQGYVELRTKTKLEISPAKQQFRVGAHGEAEATFDVRGDGTKVSAYDRKQGGYYYSFGIGEGYIVEAVVKCGDGSEDRQSRGLSFLPCVRSPEPPKLDGREDDWQPAVWFEVDPASRANGLPFFANVHSHHKEDVKMYFKGRSDLSARWAAMWDEDRLYLFFRVFDDVFHQENTADLIWNGDSVRMAIDPQPDSTDAGVQPRPRDPSSFLYLDLGLTPEGPQLYRRYQACGHAPGAVRSAEVFIARLPDGLAYELAIPWAELGGLRAQTGGWIQMSLAFDDSDGHGRKTWINWFGGLGGIAREPRLMGDLSFVELDE